MDENIPPQSIAAPRKAHHDLTQGGIGEKIRRLAWPVMLGQILFMIPDLYDAAWLGRLGPEAQAAAGFAQSIRITMISLLMGMSRGAGAVIARYVGAKDEENADLATMQSIILTVTFSGVLGVIGIIFAEPLMQLAGADAQTLPLAVRYARVLFAGLIAMEMVPTVGFMLSSSGAPDVLVQMRAAATITILIGEPLLVNAFGLEGAVLAVVLSNAVGMLWGLWMLVSGRAPVELKWRKLHADFPMMKRILRIALPSAVQQGMPNLAMSVLMRIIGGYGAATVAAWEIARRIFSTALIPGFGLARSAPAMVGQNLGAAQPERAERAVSLIARSLIVIVGLIVIVLAVFAPQAVDLFSDDAGSIATGAHIIRLVGLGYIAYALNMVYDLSLAGAGDAVIPMAINLVTLWFVQIPLVFLLSRAFGETGIWFGMMGGWFAQMGLTYLRYKQGHWKVKRI